MSSITQYFVIWNNVHQCNLSFSYVFWFGDLNFRIDNVKNEDIRKKAKEGDFEPLLKDDQVRNPSFLDTLAQIN